MYNRAACPSSVSSVFTQAERPPLGGTLTLEREEELSFVVEKGAIDWNYWLAIFFKAGLFVSFSNVSSAQEPIHIR